MTSNPLDNLEAGPLHHFREWPNPLLPALACGIYTIWDAEGRFIYVGIAGRDLERARANNKAKSGLSDRLRSHWSGARSGDQFCVYVCDRLLLRTLTSEQIEAVSAGELPLDKLVRQYIHDNLSYRFVETVSYAEAMALENQIKAGALKAGKPLLNPAKTEHH